MESSAYRTWTYAAAAYACPPGEVEDMEESDDEEEEEEEEEEVKALLIA